MSAFANMPEFSIASLKAAALDVPPAFKGRWATIELRPDLFVPQAFTVGVIVQADGGETRYSLLDSFKKFECIYGKAFPKQELYELMQKAAVSLGRIFRASHSLDAVEFDTPNLYLSAPAFTSGGSVEGVLERLFRELVVMRPSARESDDADSSVSTARARELVNEELKRIAGLDYEKIIVPEDAQFFEDSAGALHKFDVGLITPGGCGSVISASYKAPATIEINLLRASSDVASFAKLKSLQGRSIFVLSSEQSSSDVSSLLGEQLWKLESAGFRVSEFPTPIEVARDIYEWAAPSLRR